MPWLTLNKESENADEWGRVHLFQRSVAHTTNKVYNVLPNDCDSGINQKKTEREYECSHVTSILDGGR